MMAKLINKSKTITLIEELSIAKSFASRAKGLIGTKTLNTKQGLWFPKCNWIHTFFMSMPIDVIYLDKTMTVKKLEKNLKPWKLAAPVFKADSVVEVSAGFINQTNIEVGDHLDVGY